MSPSAGRPLVYKFGGSSVADAQRFAEVARLIKGVGRPPVVVVSALGGVTDGLMRAAATLREGAQADSALLRELRERHQEVLGRLVSDPTERERLAREIDEELLRLESTAEDAGSAAELQDRATSLGEDLSALLLVAALRQEGADATAVDARRIVRTDGRFGRARPVGVEIDCLARQHLLPLLERGSFPVVQGFVGATADGRTTTLGRGGSDFTAVLLGAALDAECVHIWTDVDGILSGDPRTVIHPRILQRVGYEEAVELAYFGAKVIHPDAAKHAVSRGVPLHIRNTFRPDAEGTVILSERTGGAEIAAVASKPRVVLIKVRSHPSALQYGFLARVFEVLGRQEVPVDLVATSHSSTAFTIDEREEIGELAEELSAFSEVEVTQGLTTITVVGHGLMEEPGTDALVFRTVEKTPVHLISQASDVSVSFVVAESDAPDLVRKLHITLIERRDEQSRRGLQ